MERQPSDDDEGWSTRQPMDLFIARSIDRLTHDRNGLDADGCGLVQGMFAQASAFNQNLPWDVSRVKSFFQGAAAPCLLSIRLLPSTRHTYLLVCSLSAALRITPACSL